MFMLQTSAMQELLGEDTTPNELTMDRLLKTPARLGVGFPVCQIFSKKAELICYEALLLGASRCIFCRLNFMDSFD